MEAFFYWLLETFGSRKIDDWLDRNGLKAQNRALTTALLESQNYRRELADIAQQTAQIAQDRDEYFDEIVRLRIENAALKQRIAELENR